MAEQTLDALIAAAREAEPGDRIGLRDAIAKYGDEAIDAMRDLLVDRRLAARLNDPVVDATLRVAAGGIWIVGAIFALAAAVVAYIVYAIGFIASFWLPEPKQEELPE